MSHRPDFLPHSGTTFARRRATVVTRRVRHFGSGTLFLILIAATLLSAPAPEARAGLVAYYKLDGSVADETGRHPGTLFGTTNFVAGRAGQALNFSLNAQSQPTYMDLASPGLLDFGKDFSVSLWLKTTSTSQRVFLSKAATNIWSYPGKQFMTSGQQLLADCYGVGSQSGNFTTNGVNISDGQWHHVVLTYTASISPYWTWYADGYRRDSYGRDFTVAADDPSHRLRLGWRENGSSVYFLGQMDEVQIYDRGLTPDDVAFLFQNPGHTVTNAPAQVPLPTLFPRAAAPPSQTISTINVEGMPKPDLFMLLTLQGCANRTQPAIFLIGRGIVEMQSNLSSQFWLDRMTDFTKTNFADAYSLIRAFTNRVNGCVLFDPTVFNATSDDHLARINLVTMLCGKHQAVALTTAQAATLAGLGVNLPILADARTLPTSWAAIYSYALTNFGPSANTRVLHHLGGKNGTNFCMLNVDYLVAQKIFSFNFAVTTPNPTTIENQILALTPPNTPVIGVWGLDYGLNEHGYVSRVTASGKFLVVTYESANLSFTTGLPQAPIPIQKSRALTLDTNKVYVAFSETDGDNLSFVDRIFPLWMNVTNRVAYPLGWEVCVTLNELNPVAAEWFYRNIGTTFVAPVAGVGYAWNAGASPGYSMPAAAHLGAFLQLSDTYMASMRQSFVRTIWTDYESALPFGALTQATGIHIGYTGSGVPVSGVQSASFISRGKAFFRGYDFAKDMTNIAQYAGSAPAFFSVGCQYVPVSAIVSAADALPSRFMVVSPDELAALCRQHRSADVALSQEITGAEFGPLDARELLYLYELRGASTNTLFSGTRYADYTNSWTYQFNLKEGTSEASSDLTVYNHYTISASSNGIHWETVAQASSDVHDGGNLSTISLDLSRFLLGPGNNVYLRFADASPASPWGAGLTHLTLRTTQTLPPTQKVGEWPANEGSGTAMANISGTATNWDMLLQGDPNLWGYWQSGAYAFAGGNNIATTALTSARAWPSGFTLTLKADFNLTGNLHDLGSVFTGGAVFGAGYFIPGGNSLGYNPGAFYAIVDAAIPSAPKIEFNVSGIAPGAWSHPLPLSVTSASLNGGWNTAEWVVENRSGSNSMFLQMKLNGTNVGGGFQIPGGYLRDFSEYANYSGTKFYIGAAADQSYRAFQGSLRNVSLVASVPTPHLDLSISNGNSSLTITGTTGVSYRIDTTETLGGDWQERTNISLRVSPSQWVDTQTSGVSRRFYRAVATE